MTKKVRDRLNEVTKLATKLKSSKVILCDECLADYTNKLIVFNDKELKVVRGELDDCYFD